MSSTAVTPSGFVKKTLATLKAEYEALLRASFGDGIDLAPSGPFGQLVGLLSKRDADLWDLAQAIYTSRDPGQATGVALDSICAETGVLRKDATPTIIDWVRLFSDAEITIPAGSKIRRPNSDTTFSLAGAVVITSEVCSEAQLTLTPSSSVYTLVLNDLVYSYTRLGGDTDAMAIDALIALVEAGPFIGGIERTAGPTLRIYQDTGVFSLYVSNLTFVIFASSGTFVCDTDGAIGVAEASLTEIVTPVSGWLSVTNPIAGTTGREVETDSELRIRRLSSARTGKATEHAILSALLREVTNLVSASITSNRTSITDPEGRPPKSFEVVVEGGTNMEVALLIWDTMPAGIESFGNLNSDGSVDPDGDGTGITITDSQGYPQVIHFSRPETKYLHIEVKRSFYDEEAYPVDGDEQIKQAIVTWGLTEYQLGKDVILQRITSPIYSVPGVEDIQLRIAITNLPGDTPVFGTTNISIGIRQLAQVTEARISVGAI